MTEKTTEDQLVQPSTALSEGEIPADALSHDDLPPPLTSKPDISLIDALAFATDRTTQKDQMTFGNAHDELDGDKEALEEWERLREETARRNGLIQEKDLENGGKAYQYAMEDANVIFIKKGNGIGFSCRHNPENGFEQSIGDDGSIYTFDPAHPENGLSANLTREGFVFDGSNFKAEKDHKFSAVVGDGIVRAKYDKDGRIEINAVIGDISKKDMFLRAHDGAYRTVTQEGELELADLNKLPDEIKQKMSRSERQDYQALVDELRADPERAASQGLPPKEQDAPDQARGSQQQEQQMDHGQAVASEGFGGLSSAVMADISGVVSALGGTVRDENVAGQSQQTAQQQEQSAGINDVSNISAALGNAIRAESSPRPEQDAAVEQEVQSAPPRRGGGNRSR